jgi:hypothetical protein
MRREDFSMKDQDIFLEPWKDDKHSYTSHYKIIGIDVDFLDVGMRSDDSKYRKAIKYELPFYLKESKMLREKGD